MTPTGSGLASLQSSNRTQFVLSLLGQLNTVNGLRVFCCDATTAAVNAPLEKTVAGAAGVWQAAAQCPAGSFVAGVNSKTGASGAVGALTAVSLRCLAASTTAERDIAPWANSTGAWNGWAECPAFSAATPASFAVGVVTGATAVPLQQLLRTQAAGALANLLQWPALDLSQPLAVFSGLQLVCPNKTDAPPAPREEGS